MLSFSGNKEGVEAELSSGGLDKGCCVCSSFLTVLESSGDREWGLSTLCPGPKTSPCVSRPWVPNWCSRAGAASEMMVDSQDLWMESSEKRSTQPKREGTQVCNAAPRAT